MMPNTSTTPPIHVKVKSKEKAQTQSTAAVTQACLAACALPHTQATAPKNSTPAFCSQWALYESADIRGRGSARARLLLVHSLGFIQKCPRQNILSACTLSLAVQSGLHTRLVVPRMAQASQARPLPPSAAQRQALMLQQLLPLPRPPLRALRRRLGRGASACTPGRVRAKKRVCVRRVCDV